MVTGPTDLIKSNLQIQNNNNTRYSQIISDVIKTNGIKGVFKGTGTTLIRDVPSYGLYFGTHEYIKRYFSPIGDGKHCKPQFLLLAGASAGIVGWASTYPFGIY